MIEELEHLEQIQQQETVESCCDWFRDYTVSTTRDCAIEECENRTSWSLQYFQERDMFREPSYSEASSEQRAEYIRDFHDKFSELSGYSRNLHFSNRMESHNLGAFNPLTKRIDLNVNLLRDADPLQVMEIVMHES